MTELRLGGCRPLPLAHYLKALGVLRLVAEQSDRDARGSWEAEVFRLESGLDSAALEEFFLTVYEPTPLVAPWNGGSGFFPKDNSDALDALRSSAAPRFEPYRRTLALVDSTVADLGLAEKVDERQKIELLEACRSRMPDQILPWLDAAFVLTSGGAQYPPLLGTGGNDGRLEFTNNFMQRLVELFDASTGAPLSGSHGLLRHALFGELTDALQGKPIGQFLPSRAGGANAGSGFSGSPSINPWEYVLTLEGAVVFAAAAVRRLGESGRGALASPFTVRLSAVGYGSSAGDTESVSRGEIWLPLWERSVRIGEVEALFSEGRARVGRRAARTGVDFARAVATLGIDRGIRSFQRIGFQQRFGRNYFAVPMGRFSVEERPGAQLLHEIDGWLDLVRRRVAGTGTPSSVRRVFRALEESILALCEKDAPDRLRQVLITLGSCERALARSLRWASDDRVRVPPVPLLSGDWLAAIDDGSSELRLAASLASLRATRKIDGKPWTFFLRPLLEPVTYRSSRRGGFDWRTGDASGRDPDVTWNDGPLPGVLNDLFQRRLVRLVTSGAATYDDFGTVGSDLGAVADFIEGRVDEALVADLLWGCVLIHPYQIRGRLLTAPTARRGTLPGSFYALLKLCFPNPSSERPLPAEDESRRQQEAPAEAGNPVPMVPRIHRLAALGMGSEAARAAIQRLRASGPAPRVRDLAIDGELARRTAAAVVFPIPGREVDRLRRTFLALRSDTTIQPGTQRHTRGDPS